MAVNIYSSIAENHKKVFALTLAFPLALAVFCLIALLIPFALNYFNATTIEQQQIVVENAKFFLQTEGLIITGVTVLASLVWVAISWFMGSKMILSSAGAIKIEPGDDKYRELTRLVENISITAGIKCPEIYIIEDESCNAFATGSSPKHAAVTFTTGILKKLNKQELEGVVAHEISHIVNYDVRTMVLMISCIGFCTFVGELLLRGGLGSSRSRNSKNGGGGAWLILLGIALLVFGYILAPLMRLATSRKQEYRADANAALLTRNPLALASALEKISVDSRVEALDSKKLASSICIANPLEKKEGFFSKIAGLTKTHPPIDKRIELLKGMGK
tara:strand:- start:2089 stop:3087 length:999 start_codon:yes stop_codon:yes gene_type:complete